jgi:myo-inositol-1(or 4)-monophosphatase
MNFKPYLDFACDLVYQAGKICLEYYQKDLSPDYKSDHSPVTAADRAVENYIRMRIEKSYPEHDVLGEEYGGQGSAGKSIRWIIDPIDGTKSFMRGIPLFAVLLGMEVDGVIRAGTAYFPALDEMISAADGEGCWWNGKRAYVSKIDSLQNAFVCFTSLRSSLTERQSRLWSEVHKKAYALRGWSDAYGYLAVATGRAEIVLDPVMKIWDCGPFPPIFREAGGYFGNWDGVEGHTHGEALACNAKLLPVLQALTNGK